jgi:ribosome maturation factor RimP
MLIFNVLVVNHKSYIVYRFMEKIIKEIEQLLNQYMIDKEHQDMFIVDISIGLGNQLQILMDTDEGINLDQCKKISRFVEHYIDEKVLLGEKYGIEVSSPGVGKPLIFERQYRKNISRLMEITLLDNPNKLKARLMEVHEDKIILQHEEKVQQENSKKKIMTTFTHEIPYTNIKQAIVKIEF